MSSIMTHKISNYLACFYADFCLLKYETAPNWMVFWKYFPKGKKEKERKRALNGRVLLLRMKERNS